ncbi:TPA: hypothetical protein ACH3X1_014386 [Trebouxia sp. C0004]
MIYVMALPRGFPMFARCQHTVRLFRVLPSSSAAVLAWTSTTMRTFNQATAAQSALIGNVEAARSSRHLSFVGSFSSSAVLSADRSDPNRSTPHPEILGSDTPPSQAAGATGPHKPGGWDPPDIPGSILDHPQPSKDHPSERRSSPSLPEDGGSDKLQRDRGMYVIAKPPQTESPIPSRGSPEAPLQDAFESDSQGQQAPSIPQHQMPGVPGDLIPPGVPPQLPQSPDSDSPPGVDPSILMSQEQQPSSTQVTENVDSHGSGYWAGRVPGTPISHSDE